MREGFFLMYFFFCIKKILNLIKEKAKANKKERKGMGFDIDLISILKLQSK